MALTRLRGIVDGFPEVSERLSHGSVTFFIRDKRVLCYLSDDHHGDGRLALICAAPPGVQEEMIAADPERLYRPRTGGLDATGSDEIDGSSSTRDDRRGAPARDQRVDVVLLGR